MTEIEFEQLLDDLVSAAKKVAFAKRDNYPLLPREIAYDKAREAVMREWRLMDAHINELEIGQQHD